MDAARAGEQGRGFAVVAGEVHNLSQRSAVSQVGEAITQMDQVMQQNAALVELSAAAAERLKQQAGHLVQTVAVFRFDHEAAGGAVASTAAASRHVTASLPPAASPRSARANRPPRNGLCRAAGGAPRGGRECRSLRVGGVSGTRAKRLTSRPRP